MPKLIQIAPALLVLCLMAAPAQAVPGGELDTLKLGKWFCETPGDAVLPAIPMPSETFIAVPDSTYIAADGAAGSYLLLGDELVMTTGSLQGHRFRLETGGTIHRIDAKGTETTLRCVRSGDPAANHLDRPGIPGSVDPTVAPPQPKS